MKQISAERRQDLATLALILRSSLAVRQSLTEMVVWGYSILYIYFVRSEVLEKFGGGRYIRSICALLGVERIYSVSYQGYERIYLAYV